MYLIQYSEAAERLGWNVKDCTDDNNSVIISRNGVSGRVYNFKLNKENFIADMERLASQFKDEVETVLQALCYILLNEEIQENEPSNAKVLPKTSSVNNDGYAYLNRAIIVDGCEAIEAIAVSKKWLADYISDDDDAQDIQSFMENYTTEDTDQIVGQAILDNTIAFTFCEDRNPKIELYGDKNESAEVVIDYISQVLQDNGYENASKYIDAMFEL